MKTKTSENIKQFNSTDSYFEPETKEKIMNYILIYTLVTIIGMELGQNLAALKKI